MSEKECINIRRVSDGLRKEPERQLRDHESGIYIHI